MQYSCILSSLLYYFLCLVFLNVELVHCRKTLKDRRSVNFKEIFAFGDSYTDNSSFDRFYESNSNEIEASSLHPSTSEMISRSADGPLWVEHLTEMLGDDLYLYDFARSGSTANNDILPRRTEDMDTQVNRYLKSTAASASKSRAIFFLWTGVNDINDLFKMHKEKTPQRDRMLRGIVSTIEQDWNKLYEAEAKYIVFLGLIPLDEMPMYDGESSSTRSKLRELVLEYNDALMVAMDRFRASKPTVQAFYFDTFGAYNHIVSLETDGDDNDDTRRHCNSGNDCGNLIWWDRLHPTSKTHFQIAQALVESMQKHNWL